MCKMKNKDYRCWITANKIFGAGIEDVRAMCEREQPNVLVCSYSLRLPYLPFTTHVLTYNHFDQRLHICLRILTSPITFRMFSYH